MIIPLADAGVECGHKAFALREMIDAGLPVPDGVVIPRPSSTDWQGALDRALDRLGADSFAVRSSARDEDGERASFAGQLHTGLRVKREDVAAEVRRTSHSIGAPGVQAYATAMDRDLPSEIPVIIQRMLEPDISGVAFTRHPTTGADQDVIEAIGGLGDQLVSGLVTPERWVLDGSKIITAEKRDLLSEQQVHAIAGIAREIEDLFTLPQDVEWATTGDQLWILQARPITTGRPSHLDSSIPLAEGDLLLTGTPASSGTTTGQVKIIGGLDDFDRFRPGDILVCRTTSPAWTPLLARAGAVVTETGGLLAHAAIVAREFGIPAVLAADRAMTVLHDDQWVVVDGTAGIVASTLTRRSRDDAQLG